MKYDHKIIEESWRRVWEENKLYQTKDDNTEKYYVLDMFAYPSGEGLHMGHARIYTASDVYARLRMMQGYDVLHPTGWDAFGLPAEQYAIKTKTHPTKVVAQNTARFREQMQRLAFSYDWSREINTTDPSYYKWTQWAFVQMFKKGLAYESFEPINWCPTCQTGLANEDLDNGRCERCGSIVEKKPMRQWVLKITDYAERLLDDLNSLNWIESHKESQRNWIGRSEGAEIDFSIVGSPEKITVFTTRADTLFGVTYLVLAPEHELMHKLENKIENLEEVKKYIEAASQKTEIDRTNETRERTGLELKGLRAINPATKEEIPVWVGDYVIADYGTGAVMAVPAHDKDYEFAKEHGLAIKQVIAPETGVKRENETQVKGVCAIVYNPKTEKFAVAEWADGWGKGLYGLFGGGREDNETPEEAIYREMAEESGLQDFASVEYLYSSISHYYNGPKKSARRAVVDCFLIVLNSDAHDDGKREEHETFTVGWRTAEEILSNWKERDTAPDQEKNYDHWIEFLQRGVVRLQEQKIIKGEKKFSFGPFTELGFLCNSGKFNNLTSIEGKKEIVKAVGGRTVVKYKLRDWVFSRQRYWGEPIPIIHCEKCGAVPVPEKDLPVELPDVEHYEPSGTGESPLANIPEWVNVKCPKCSGDAKRETNTMPQWAGSSWYYLRYIDPNNNEALVDPKKEKKWMPVDTYIGGNEHITRHLIYARFWHKFLYDIGVVSTIEPFTQLRTVGLILAGDGRKMSKRWGNVINPDEMADRYGVDALRVYMMFIGPFAQPASFLETGVAAAQSFLNRIVTLSEKISATAKEEKSLQTLVHQTIKKVGDDIIDFRFNTAVSSLMILANALGEVKEISSATFSIFLRLLAPIAPYLSEELWKNLGTSESIFNAGWPEYDEALLINESATIAVQVNGKLRDTFEIASSASEDDIKTAALARAGVQKWIEGAEIKKVIVVKGKLVSIVI